MSFYNNNPTNPPVSTRTFQARGKNYFNMSDGLQGVDLEFAKTRLVLGRSLSRLVSAMKRHGLDNQAMGTEIKNRLRIEPGFAAQCVLVSRAYRPDDNEADGFEFYYLIAIPHEVLLEFHPHVNQFFKDPNQGIGPNMWVSRNSIEIYAALDGGQPLWWDLKFLTVDQVKALPTLVAQTGLPPQQLASTGYGQSYPSYQASHISNAEEVWYGDNRSDASNEPLSMEDIEAALMEDWCPSPQTPQMGNRPNFVL